jgi:hypothetical protein
MTAIYIELAGKKAITWSLEWPGWCRIRTSEEAAIQALIDYTPRYRLIAQRAGLEFAPGVLMVTERLAGDANTAWGIPSVLAPAETRPIDAATAQRRIALLRYYARFSSSSYLSSYSISLPSGIDNSVSGRRWRTNSTSCVTAMMVPL